MTMTIDIDSPRITSMATPRKQIATDFELLDELPIRGGWGYTLEDAVIIDKNDPVVPKDQCFSGIGIEKLFVEYRIYEELIISRPENDRYDEIEWKLLKQSLTGSNGRKYDLLAYEVTALPDKDLEKLNAEWAGPNGYESPGFDLDAYMKKHDSHTIRYVTEYWFDITSFFGSE